MLNWILKCIFEKKIKFQIQFSISMKIMSNHKMHLNINFKEYLEIWDLVDIKYLYRRFLCSRITIFIHKYHLYVLNYFKLEY